MMKTLLPLLPALLLCGCVAQIPFRTVQYPGAPGRTVEKTASVAHNEIDVAQGTNSFAMALRMTIAGGRAADFAKDYFVVSDEGDSTGDKWTTNASEGKIKLVRRLLAVLIPDIRAYAESSA